jgi:UDP-N-acetylglucosamine--N-acetylmuramyl-(pentapeptide) pyrophosphoryl-undecaprenol N-acetylglucosamine transferase
MMIEALGSWPKEWHVIHLTGKDRPGALAEQASKTFTNYHVYKFFTNEMKMAYALAQVVIGRAGFGTLSELAALSKAAIIIPMPNTHQEENADFLAKHGGIIKLQEGSAGLKLAHIVTELVLHPKYREEMGKLLHNLLPQTAPEKVVEIIDRLIKRK